MMIDVVCIEGLHEFTVDAAATAIACPTCGCRHARRAKTSAPDGIPTARRAREVVVRVEKARQLVNDQPTWLGDRKTFAEVARKHAPEISDAELRAMTLRWHDDGEPAGR